MKKRIRTANGLYVYQYTPIFLGIKRIDKTIADENLKLIKHVLDKEGLTFMLGFGTLLGAIRDHDFISHDEDIDLLMFKRDQERFLSLLFKLRENGFEVARYESRGFLSLIRKGEYIDFYFYDNYPEDDRLLYCCRDLYFKDALMSPCTITFRGEEYLAPANPIKYLEFNYGSNWHIPLVAVDFKMSTARRWKMSIVQYIKAILPEKLVEHLQHKADAKFINMWVEKAQSVL